MSGLYGGRPSSSSSASTSRAAPPRFEFGSTLLQRADATLALRTQPHSYPHHAEAAPAARHAPPPPSHSHSARRARRTVRPASASASAASSARPVHCDNEVRDRYLPTPPQPYGATVAAAAAGGSGGASLLALPHSYAGIGAFPFTEEDYLPTAGPAPVAPAVPALPSAHTIARAHAARVAVKGGGPEAFTFSPALNRNYLAVEPRARGQGQLLHSGAPPPPRDFMATPAYFAFLDAQEEAERRSAEEDAHAAAALLKGHRPSDRQTFAPSMAYPARFSAAHAASAASAAAAAAATPVSAVVRLPTALGLHTRTLDALQILRSLRAQLDSCFEIVRIDERERRGREARQAQATLKQKHMELAQAVTSAAAAAAAPAADAGGIQRIQAGHISIPNTPNVTSTTLALLAHVPVHSSDRNRAPSAAVAAASTEPQQPPTFLTDAEIESHALSNLTPAQRRSAFGRGFASAVSNAAASTSFSGEEKEAPFDREDLSTHPDAAPPRRPAPQKLGERRPGPTQDLPEEIVYTPEMCREFEESVKLWGKFLVESNEEAAAAAAAQSFAASAAAQRGGAGRAKAPSASASAAASAASARALLHADLLLVLRDASAKYASLIRLAMNPSGQGQGQGHHLLPRMMEATWKIVMLVVEVALGNRREDGECKAAPGGLAANNEANAVAVQPPSVAPASASTGDALTVLASQGASTLSVAAPPFDPLRADDRADLDARMSSYETSMVLTGPASATSAALAAAADVRNALSVQRREDGLRDAGLYSVGLMLQRDSLLASSERLMRENELLKLRLRETTAQVTHLQSQQDTELRALAQRGEDTVGMALDDLDEWMEDAIDARREQLDAVARVGDLAWDYSQKHAASVAAEATADESHRESMDTLRRLQARETELGLVRAAELQEREAAALAASTDKAKAAAVLDRELRLLELLTTEEIEAKVSQVTDATTLRAMICKLLHIKIKRPTHETPSQRVARLRKEATPRLLRSVLLRVHSDRLLPLKQLARQLLEIYMCKICADDAQARELKDSNGMALPAAPAAAADASLIAASGRRRGVTPPTLHAFLSEWMLQRYGLRRIAETNLVELLRSVQVYLYPDRASHRRYAQSLSTQSADLLDRCARPRLAWFARMCHLYVDEPLPQEATDFCLFVLRALQEAAEQAVPPAFSTAYSHKDSAADSARAMLRTLELACVPITLAGTGMTSARSTKRSSLDLSAASLALARTTNVTTAVQTAAAVAQREEELASASGGPITMYVPLFLGVECVAHAFRQLGYSDDGMDAALVDLEREYIYPLNTSARATTDSGRLRMLLKQIVARQMVRSGGAGSASPAMVFERFDTDRSGVVGVAKLRTLISMDDETTAQLDALLQEHCGATGGLICADLAQALSPDYRLCVPLDTLLERATLSWLAEHQALTLRYRTAAAAVEGPGAKGLLNNTELLALIQALEPAADAVGSVAGALPRAIRSFASKLFREGMEMERRAAQAAQVAEAAAAARAAKKSKRRGGGSGKKKDSGAAPPTVVAPPPPPPAVVVAVSIESLVSSSAASPTAAASPATDVPASAPSTPTADADAASSPPTPQSRSVQFAPDVSGGGSGGRPPLSKPALLRQSSLSPTDFISVDTCVALLRRHRIGLPLRKPFNEFKCFLRRYRLSRATNSGDQQVGARSSTDATATAAAVAAGGNGLSGSTAPCSPSAAAATANELELDQDAMPITTIQE